MESLEHAKSTQRGSGEPDRWLWDGLPVLLGIAAVPLGILGYWSYDLQHPGPTTVWDWAYQTLQLFVLHGMHLEHATPLTLQLARFLAPAATILGLARAVAAVLREPWESARAAQLKDHTVVFGEGPIVNRLLLDLSTAGAKVVSAGPGDPPGGRRRGKWLHVRCSPEEGTPVLRRLGIEASKAVVVAGRDDAANIATALRLQAYVEEQGPRRAARSVPCHVHTTDLALRRLFAKHRLFSTPVGSLTFGTFNVYEDCARALLDESPLDRVRMPPTSKTVVRLVIVGFGRMGENLAVHAAQVGHFANAQALEIIVFDQHAEAREAAFLDRYPYVGDTCAIEFRTRSIPGSHLVDELTAVLSDPDRVATLAICINNDMLDAALTLRLFDHLRRNNIPGLVRFSSSDGLAALLRTEPFAKHQVLRPFNVLGPSISRNLVERPHVDELARAIHEDFRTRRLHEGRAPTDPAMRPWESLGPDFRESNRRQGDHIPVKLRAIGCSILDHGKVMQPFTGFEPGEVDVLAKMEHARWMAERLLAGWRYGPTRDDVERTSPHLVPWAKLPPEVQNWDREAVQNVPALVQSIGKAISR